MAGHSVAVDRRAAGVDHPVATAALLRPAVTAEAAVEATDRILADIQARLKVIEDELGITEKRELKEAMKALKEIYRSYGFTASDSKTRAWYDAKAGITPLRAETELIRRGAVKKLLDI